MRTQTLTADTTPVGAVVREVTYGKTTETFNDRRHPARVRSKEQEGEYVRLNFSEDREWHCLLYPGDEVVVRKSRR